MLAAPGHDSPELADRGPDELGQGSPGPGRVGLGDVHEEREGEAEPPQPDTREREPRGGIEAGEAEAPGGQDPRQIDREQEAAPDVPVGEAARRDPVELAGRGHAGEQRVVEHVGRGEREEGEHEQHEEGAPLAARNQRHRGGGERAHQHQPEEQRLPPAEPVAGGPEDQAGHRAQEHGAGAGVAPGRGGEIVGHRVGGELGEERRKDGGDHRGRERRVSPVVEAPRPDRAPRREWVLGRGRHARIDTRAARPVRGVGGEERPRASARPAASDVLSPAR